MSFSTNGESQTVYGSTQDNFFSENKGIILGIVALVIVVLTGTAMYSAFSDKSNAEINAKIYEFEKNSLQKLTNAPEDKTIATEVLNSFKTLQAEHGSYVGLTPAIITTSDALVGAGELSGAAEILEKGLDAASTSYAKFFILSRLAVVYEDLNNVDKAIETLTKMTSNNAKVFEGKIYLDLGRLYLKKGEKDLAKKNFEHVVNTANTDAEFVKVARIYLSEL